MQWIAPQTNGIFHIINTTNTMFTWIPIHEEAAKRLLDFKDRNHELVDILARMKARNLLTTKIDDQGTDDVKFQLKEIDPFTFFANFNRGTKDTNRKALWQVLKTIGNYSRRFLRILTDFPSPTRRTPG